MTIDEFFTVILSCPESFLYFSKKKDPMQAE